jgi:hypothetical protein
MFAEVKVLSVYESTSNKCHVINDGKDKVKEKDKNKNYSKDTDKDKGKRSVTLIDFVSHFSICCVGFDTATSLHM